MALHSFTFSVRVTTCHIPFWALRYISKQNRQKSCPLKSFILVKEVDNNINYILLGGDRSAIEGKKARDKV